MNRKCIHERISCRGELIWNGNVESEGEKLMCKKLNSKEVKIGILKNL
jgi:hypothetical protein